MRVISGTHKGRRLVCPAGRATRPTADRIKESIFNILAGQIANQRVLDLFAGTGALGIEALSRGADTAVFIDQASAALTAIRKNIHTLGLEARSRVIRWDIRKNLSCLGPESPFELVFMDPPYGLGAVPQALELLVSKELLATGARVVIEHDIRDAVSPSGDQLQLTDQRRFGKTLVSFMDAMV